MEMRLIQLLVPEAQIEDVRARLDRLEAGNWWRTPVGDDADRRTQFHILAKPHEAQDIMDAISDCLEGQDGWRQMLIPLEGVAPDLLTEEDEEEMRTSSQVAERETILSDVRAGATLTPDYLIMTALSTVVAAIGLNLDQVAAVIGAMVIAPLLGPIMGISLGVALGIRRLILSAALSLLAGLAVAAAVSGALALILEVNPQSRLLDYTEPVTLATMVLALASGAAAAIATASGKTGPLVGVMVAAALLPPIAATGLLLASAEWREAGRSAFIMFANFVCIGLAAQVTFIAKGVRPRRWAELKASETSRRVNLVTLGVLALGLAAVIWFWDVV